MTVLQSIGIAAPYYNLAFVIIVFALFAYLFRIPNRKDVYIRPWKFLLYGMLLFVAEELMTVLSALGLVVFPHILFAFFEMGMIILFMHMCLLQMRKK